MSVAAPLVLPCIKTVAPMISSLVFKSLIVPLITPVCCAVDAKEINTNKIK